MRSSAFHPLLGGFSIITALAMGGCATESYVDTHVAALQSHINQVDSQSQAAMKLASGKFNYKSSPGATINFETGSYKISDEDKAKLDALATQLQQEDKNIYVAIEGYADPRGGKKYNVRLGLQRAYMVADYLREKGVALNRMTMFTHGEDNPTDMGHEADRRVEVTLEQ